MKEIKISENTLLKLKKIFLWNYFYLKMQELLNDYKNNSNDDYKFQLINKKISDELNNNTAYEIIENNENLKSISYCPEISKNTINDLNEIFEKAKASRRKRSLLGVIKFIHDGREYIHCPIRKVKKGGEIVKFGICKHTNSFLNNAENRKKLSAHKFQFHYLSKRPTANNVNLHFKTTESLEDIISKIKNKMNYKKAKKTETKCLNCVNCNCSKSKENKEERKINDL